MNTIKVVSTLGTIKTIETNAVIFEELIPSLENIGINPVKMTLVIEGSNLELSHPKAELPKGNFNLFAYPKEVKSGVDLDTMEKNIKKIKDNVDTMYSEIDEISYKLDTILDKLYEDSSTIELESNNNISQEDMNLLQRARELAESFKY